MGLLLKPLCWISCRGSIVEAVELELMPWACCRGSGSHAGGVHPNTLSSVIHAKPPPPPPSRTPHPSLLSPPPPGAVVAAQQLGRLQAQLAKARETAAAAVDELVAAKEAQVCAADCRAGGV